MKTIFPAIFLLSLCGILTAQEAKRPDQLAFESALATHYDLEPEKALSLFRAFLKGFPESPLQARAQYNIGYLLYELDRKEEAIPIFESILHSNVDEMEELGGLMEAYTLYKHRSAKHLFEIYLEKENYKKARTYLRLFDKKYPYRHFCGNEYMADAIYTACAYARIYHGIGKTDKAIRQLLPYMFENGLASNAPLVDLLLELLADRYAEPELQSAVSKAVASLRSNNKGTFIRFLGKQIEVENYVLYNWRNPEYLKNLDLDHDTSMTIAVRLHPIISKYLQE